MTAALAIFVKTPGLSPVKTRLAKDIGTQAAIEFHRLAAAAVAAVARDCGATLRPYWAVAEAGAVNDDAWPGFPRIWQGEGGLGERLHQVYAGLLDRHDSVLLIGADSPQMTAALLKQAVLALEHDPFVMGPAADGGFWLFGGRLNLPAAVWTSVAYSQPTTAAELIQRLHAFGAVSRISELIDVDAQSDLRALLASMTAQKASGPEHAKLVNWVRGQLLVAATEAPSSAAQPGA